MATLTPNYNLSKPEATDPFGDFRDSYNDNLDIIDANLGGGGGGGDVMDVEVNGVSVLDPDDKIAKITSYEEVTLAEYEAIPAGDRETNGIAYFIKDLNNENVQGYPPLIYSDEEREVGVWRDGKPLYQRTFDLGSDINISNSSWQTSVFSISDLEKIIVIHGVNSSGTAYPLNAYHTGDNVNLLACRDGNPANVRWITAQYIKTTDTAGSGIWNGQGGIAHHYSTNETVVGTWIDGKTLYEKTWDFGQDVTVGAWTSVTDVASYNIDVLVNSISVQNSKAISQIEYWVDGTTLKGNSLRGGADDYVRYLTLQYTKTS